MGQLWLKRHPLDRRKMPQNQRSLVKRIRSARFEFLRLSCLVKSCHHFLESLAFSLPANLNPAPCQPLSPQSVYSIKGIEKEMVNIPYKKGETNEKTSLDYRALDHPQRMRRWRLRWSWVSRCRDWGSLSVLWTLLSRQVLWRILLWTWPQVLFLSSRPILSRASLLLKKYSRANSIYWVWEIKIWKTVKANEPKMVLNSISGHFPHYLFLRNSFNQPLFFGLQSWRESSPEGCFHHPYVHPLNWRAIWAGQE